MATIFSKTQDIEVSKSDLEVFYNSIEPSDGPVLDVGCRTGEWVSFLSKKDIEVVGIDLDETCIEKAKNKYPGLSEKFITLDIQNLDRVFKIKFKRIYCIGVMNYLPRSQWMNTLKKMQSLLDIDGDLIVTFTKPSILGGSIKLLKFIPENMYTRVLAPLITAVLFPFQKYILLNPVGRDHFHYKFTLSLYGLEVGYPEELEKFIINVKETAFVSNRTAVFKIFQKSRII